MNFGPYGVTPGNPPPQGQVDPERSGLVFGQDEEKVQAANPAQDRQAGRGGYADPPQE